MQLDADVLVNPGPGMAGVFRITSTIVNLAEGVPHDRARIRRLALRIQMLSLSLNTLSHFGELGDVGSTEEGGASTPKQTRPGTPSIASIASKEKEKRLSLVESAKNKLAAIVTTSSPLSMSTSNQTSNLNHSSNDADSDFEDSEKEAAQLVQRKMSSRAWNAVRRLSSMALSPLAQTAMPQLPLEQQQLQLPGTIPLSPSRRIPPSHMTLSSLLLLLERIKGFIKNNSSSDLLRIMGTRQRFEDRLKGFQGLVRTWVEEVGDGVCICV
ncbi:hypothetical protein BCR33DRAFT_562768 [Rhizoclosmatium globosum]|uniref:Uncharacterized protein n=1 Tax=Rhizoclosmatium globosum TaxID=329046 RepID=A0A1Y2B7V9_9FUNG|nr:hypothetical protein BCR33DRAFT_562768 [Rhizoclosmatium globosum]|eukprot:ORY30912.1 hypothetical protein BCR33DRAFT_562768 [Rhizoclosmatium globosum]